MKQFFSFFTLCFSILFLVACAGEEELKHTITYSNDFAITDTPDDSIQHERYLIYKEYGVPVFFNDTIQRKEKGTDHQGKPFYVYETVDLNWTFSGYNRGITYKYDYLTTPHEQMQALRYVRKYLSVVSRPMRPFSIMIADTLRVTSRSGTEKPNYHVGFRTLVFAQTKGLETDSAVQAQIKTVINDMIGERIKANKEVCDRFANSATEKSWYGREWKDLSNVETLEKWQVTSWMLSPNALYNEPPYTTYNGEDLVTLLTKTVRGRSPYVSTIEEAETIRKKMLQEMGNYGFIRAWKNSGRYTPANADEDRGYFLAAMFHLGNVGFRERYGQSALVLEKYNILYTFITETLGVEL